MKMDPRRNESTKMRRNRLSVPRLLLAGVAVLVLAVAIAYVSIYISTTPATKLTINFDFDTCFPLLGETQNTPLNQTSSGVTACFSSPSDSALAPAFSVQSYDTTFIELSQFSGKYLYDNKPSRDCLDIVFSQQLTSISLTFATVEHHTEPSNITLTAYMNSTDTTPAGLTTARGTFSNGLYPQGALSFNSGDQPFNLVRIEIPYQGPQGATNFFVDNIVVTTTQQE